MTYRFEVTQELRRAVARAVVFRAYTGRRALWMGLLVLYVALLIGVMLFIFLRALGPWVIVMMSLVFALGLAVAVGYVQTVMSVARLTKTIGESIDVTITDDTVNWGSRQKNSDYAHKDVTRLVVVDSVALLFVADGNFVFIPVNEDSLPLIERLNKRLNRS